MGICGQPGVNGEAQTSWLGGGFSRYSVDEKWLVPHFDKMLYDNAQLLSCGRWPGSAAARPCSPSGRARRSAGSIGRW